MTSIVYRRRTAAIGQWVDDKKLKVDRYYNCEFRSFICQTKKTNTIRIASEFSLIPKHQIYTRLLPT